jgi:hypothetical protein
MAIMVNKGKYGEACLVMNVYMIYSGVAYIKHFYYTFSEVLSQNSLTLKSDLK